MGNNQVKFGCVSAPMDDDKIHYNKSRRNTEPITTSSAHYVSTDYTVPLKEPNHEYSLSSDSTMTHRSRSPSPEPPYPSSSSSHDQCPSSFSLSSDESGDSIEPYHHKINIKILFLDVDGVLNNPSTKWDERENGISTKLLLYLKLILLKTGCKIVLSTTWRLNKCAKQILLHTFKTRGDINIDDIVIGQTKDLKFKGKHRTNEIYDYLKSNQYRFNVISWCALDDLSLNKYDQESAIFMNGHFIKTNPKIGISPQNALSCIDILNQNDYQNICYCQRRPCYYNSYHSYYQ